MNENLISFYVFDFPEFDKLWSRKYRSMHGDECMRELGFRSALYHEDMGYWIMNEEDFAHFVLRFK